MVYCSKHGGGDKSHTYLLLSSGLAPSCWDEYRAGCINSKAAAKDSVNATTQTSPACIAFLHGRNPPHPPPFPSLASKFLADHKKSTSFGYKQLHRCFRISTNSGSERRLRQPNHKKPAKYISSFPARPRSRLIINAW